MNTRIIKWIIAILAIQLIIKLILSTSPYSSFDEREYIEFKNKDYAIPKRAFLLEFLSYLFPSLFIGRIFVAAFTSFIVLILPFVKDKTISKNKLLFTSLVAFNPLFLKLSSMYLTDALFFTFLVVFVYLKSRKLEEKASIISCASILLRFEGLLIVSVNLIDLIIRKKINEIIFQSLLLVFFLPVLLKGLELYFTSHYKAIPEAPYFYYLFTPFLIQGFLSVFMIYAIIKNFGRNRLIDLIFVSFPLFYLVFQIGGTFADRFRYVLPTLISSTYYISSTAVNRRIRILVYILIIINLLALFPLYEYREFREFVKLFFKEIFLL